MEARTSGSGTLGAVDSRDHSSRRSFSSSTHKPTSAPTTVHHIDPPPARPLHSTDQTPQDAVAGTIGSVMRQDIINNRAGVQTVVRSSTSDSAEIKITPKPEKTSDDISSTDLLQTSEPASPISKSNSVGLATDSTQALQTAAEFSSFPYLSKAARSVLGIRQAVQNTRDNTGAFSRLAGHACTLVSAIAIAQHGRKEQAPELVESLELLVTKLEPIEKFVTGLGNVEGSMDHNMETGQIREYTERLSQALAEFGLRSNITVRIGVEQFDQKLEDLVDVFNRFGFSGPRSPEDEADFLRQRRELRGNTHVSQGEHPTPRPTNQNYHSLNQPLAHRSPPINHPPSSPGSTSPSGNRPSRFHTAAFPPLSSFPSSRGSTYNFVGGNQSNNQNTIYSGPTYNIQGHHIHDNTYNGGQGGVNNFNNYH